MVNDAPCVSPGRCGPGHSGRTLTNRFSEPNSRFAALIEANAEQGRIGLPKPRNRQSLAVHSVHDSLCGTRYPKIRVADAESRNRAMVVLSGVRVAMHRLLDTGGERL